MELCGPSGKVLGLFSPRIDLSEWEPVSSGASDEELARRAQLRGPWYTTEEVLKHLKNLDKSDVPSSMERRVTTRKEPFNQGIP